MKKAVGFAAICLIWGTTFMAIKIGLQDLPPLLAVGLRFLAAGFILAGYLAFVDGGLVLPKGPENLKLMLYLTLWNYPVPYALVYWGEQFISSGLTSVFLP